MTADVIIRNSSAKFTLVNRNFTSIENAVTPKKINKIDAVINIIFSFSIILLY
jgi:hypothetical protein